MREKLNRDGDRLSRQIEQHVSFSQSIVQLSEIMLQVGFAANTIRGRFARNAQVSVNVTRYP